MEGDQITIIRVTLVKFLILSLPNYWEDKFFDDLSLLLVSDKKGDQLYAV